MGAPFPSPEVGFDHLDPVHARLDAARARHMRRQLEAAVDHGTALLAALDLPQLDALDLAIATLDALDEETDREDDGTAEPSLGAPENHPGRFHIDMDGHHHVARARHTLGDQSQWAAGGSRDTDAEAVNEDGDDLDPGEMEEGDQEPWLGAAEGAQHYRGGDRDLEQDGEIERPWWGAHAAEWNHDGGRYA